MEVFPVSTLRHPFTHSALGVQITAEEHNSQLFSHFSTNFNSPEKKLSLHCCSLLHSLSITTQHSWVTSHPLCMFLSLLLLLLTSNSNISIHTFLISLFITRFLYCISQYVTSFSPHFCISVALIPEQTSNKKNNKKNMTAYTWTHAETHLLSVTSRALKTKYVHTVTHLAFILTTWQSKEESKIVQLKL